MKNYALIFRGFIDPRWFNSLAEHRNAVVDNTGKVVPVNGENLELKESLPPGTKVRVFCGHNFYCNTLDDIDVWEKEVEAKRIQDELALKQRLNESREAAVFFNTQIQLPAKWVAGQKDVLSGLSESSWGDGRRANTVNHILLQEDLQEGRLKRNAGDFLCSSSQRKNGKRWSGDADILEYDGDGQAYMPKITCKACLKIAQRWMEK